MESRPSLSTKSTRVAFPFIATLDDTAANFTTALGLEYTPNLALIWGLAYLTITVCFSGPREG